MSLFRVSALLAPILLAAGCVTHPVMVEAKSVTPADVAAIGQQRHVVVRIANGEKMDLMIPRDFGDAWCGYSGCVRKADIVGISKEEQRADPGETAATIVVAPIAVPLIAVMELACIPADCKNGDNKADAAALAAKPVATQRELDRAWLDGRSISKGHIAAQGSNPCLAEAGAPAADSFVNEADALDWVWAHRTEVHSPCLNSAASALLARGGPESEDRRRSMQLWSYATVRGRWTSAHCLTPKGDIDASAWRLSPPTIYDLSRGHGDPAYLRILDDAFTDPATLDWQGWSDAFCHFGVAPEDKWPERANWNHRHGPVAESSPPA